MRNAFVLVIILSIGAAIGISTPASVTEISLSSITPSGKDEGSIKNAIRTTPSETGRLKELPSNRTNIDENALYEHASAKQNNQSERAFIYINQKYKKPSLHQLYRMGQGGSEFMRRFSMIQAIPQNIMLKRHNDPCKSDSMPISSYFQEFDIPGRLSDIASYFAAPKLYNCNKINEIIANNMYNNNNVEDISERIQQPPNVYKTYSYNNIHNTHRHNSHNSHHHRNHNNHNMHHSHNNPNNQNGSNKKANPREYIELLKSPLLRASSRPVKPKYDVSPISQTVPLNYKDLLKLHQNTKQYNPKASVIVDDRKNDVRNNNYPFHSLINPTYQNKRRLHRIEEQNFEKELPKEDDVARSYDKTPDEELLDQYLKDTLEDQGTSKEVTVNGNDCRYRECNMPATKSSSSVIQQKDGKKVECKCGWQVNVKQKDSSPPRERPERDETKCNQTKSHTKPADITYYEEILTDDSSMKKSSADSKLLNAMPRSQSRPKSIFSSLDTTMILY